jgi:hypothetical protein
MKVFINADRPAKAPRQIGRWLRNASSGREQQRFDARNVGGERSGPSFLPRFKLRTDIRRIWRTTNVICIPASYASPYSGSPPSETLTQGWSRPQLLVARPSQDHQTRIALRSSFQRRRFPSCRPTTRKMAQQCKMVGIPGLRVMIERAQCKTSYCLRSWLDRIQAYTKHQIGNS